MVCFRQIKTLYSPYLCVLVHQAVHQRALSTCIILCSDYYSNAKSKSSTNQTKSTRTVRAYGQSIHCAARTLHQSRACIIQPRELGLAAVVWSFGKGTGGVQCSLLLSGSKFSQICRIFRNAPLNLVYWQRGGVMNVQGDVDPCFLNWAPCLRVVKSLTVVLLGKHEETRGVGFYDPGNSQIWQVVFSYSLRKGCRSQRRHPTSPCLQR